MPVLLRPLLYANSDFSLQSHSISRNTLTGLKSSRSILLRMLPLAPLIDPSFQEVSLFYSNRYKVWVLRITTGFVLALKNE
jgi:hypothetical protein